MTPRPPTSTLFPYTTLFRSLPAASLAPVAAAVLGTLADGAGPRAEATQPPGGEDPAGTQTHDRSEEHTSELQSHSDLVCRLLLEKKNLTTKIINWRTL